MQCLRFATFDRIISCTEPGLFGHFPVVIGRKTDFSNHRRFYLIQAHLKTRSDMNWLPLSILLLLTTQATALEWVSRPPPKWEQNIRARDIPESRIVEISPAMMERGLALLKNASAISLSQKQAEELIGSPRKKAFGRKWILVRAQFGHETTGHYNGSVSPDGKEVFVSHLSLGSYQKPRPSVILLQLWKTPRIVYGSCSFAL